MMRNIALVFFLSFFFLSNISAQENNNEFTIIEELKHTPVISQGSTGTCWSFATTSFLESEILRKGFSETDLSEMYFVKYAYLDKTERYLLYHGKNNFSQGGQAHDVLNVLNEKGIMLVHDFPGEKTDGRFQHRDLVNELDSEVNKLNKNRKNFNLSKVKSIETILEKHIGKTSKKIAFEDERITPVDLRDKFELNSNDYIEITSYSHHPFYTPFILEVPDNWSNDIYYNLPIDELVEVMIYSLKQGFTVCWDGDTSEKTFSHAKGIADLPKNQVGKVDQEMRQKTFMDRSTTDDHLMHIVGLSEYTDGRTAFYTKNSWGNDSNKSGGYLHLTEDYVRLKTIAILVHKDAIPSQIKSKLKL